MGVHQELQVEKGYDNSVQHGTEETCFKISGSNRIRGHLCNWSCYGP